MSKLTEIVRMILKNNFDLAPDAKMLVLGDTSKSELAKDFYEALLELNKQAFYVEMADRERSGEEPPPEIVELWMKHSIIFCITKHSLTHTNARKAANKAGIQVITMPGITEDMFLNGAMKADYIRVEVETLEMADKLTKATRVTILTGDGKYSLDVPLQDRVGVPSTGIFKSSSASGNLPSGEAYIAPIEYQAQGKILITGSIAGIGLVRNPVLLTIVDGRLVEASGEQGDKLLSILGDGDGRILCELGIGTNHAARITGLILEDEKAYDSIHVAFGSNHTFGGTISTNVHIDCVTREPKLIWY
ncbi:aminopeptidase [Ureibacillus manganicus]|uniref:Aminopeptidase n=1 Tax=Ureibacillus manganicus DSM 26584 TaxID=1384049 RepID=A0A0A3I667_9BACL|nr:aminopeptidase [Ureibacillus manganicus]KGR79020.1 aminopeptidase [Ureibacillus manganicus DSM 26584]